MLSYQAWQYRLLTNIAAIKYLRKNLHKGNIAVDIGAYKGAYLYWMLKRIGYQGRCYAFEPQPVLFNDLQNLKFKSLAENLIVENKGVSSTRSGYQLYIPKTNQRYSPDATLNLPSDEVEKQFQKVQIETTTLDHYFFEENIFPDLIKIDVTGHALEVMKGGEDLLKHHPPRLILKCENHHLQNHSLQEIFGFLQNKNYQGFFIFGKKMNALSEFDFSTHQKEGYANQFIFEPK